MESKSSQSQSHTNQCLLCRSLNSKNLLKPISQFKTEEFFEKENDRVYNNWAKNCIESITRVLKIPKVNSNFLNGSYCQECIQLMRDVNFTLIQLDNFQNKIIQLRQVLFEKLSSNYDAIQNKCITTTTTYADIEDPSNLEKSFTLDEVIIMVYEKIHQDTEEWSDIDGMKLIYYPAIQTQKHVEEVKYGKSKKNLKNGNIKVESINRKPRNRKRVRHDQKEKIIVETSNFPNILEDDDDSPPDFGNDDDSDWNLSDNEPVNSLNQEPETILPTDTAEDQQRKVKVHKYEPKPYHCEICEMKYKCAATFFTHMEQHNPGTQSHRCSDCGKCYSSEYNLERHMKRVHKKKYLKCSFCAMKFEKKEELIEHENLHKSNEQPFKCITCDSTFTNSTDLKKHALSHSNMSYICDYCGLRFTNVTSLQTHGRIHDPNFIGAKCSVCGHVFDEERKLSRHMTTHTDEKKFVCEICGASFKYNTGLKVHSRKHDGIYPFVCKICGKGFTLSHLLKAHEEIHSGTLAYECQICHKKFRTHNNFQQHLRIHGPKDPNAKKQIRIKKIINNNNETIIPIPPSSESQVMVNNIQNHHIQNLHNIQNLKICKTNSQQKTTTTTTTTTNVTSSFSGNVPVPHHSTTTTVFQVMHYDDSQTDLSKVNYETRDDGEEEDIPVFIGSNVQHTIVPVVQVQVVGKPQEGCYYDMDGL